MNDRPTSQLERELRAALSDWLSVRGADPGPLRSAARRGQAQGRESPASALPRQGTGGHVTLPGATESHA
jgi:hypothetical protein